MKNKTHVKFKYIVLNNEYTLEIYKSYLLSIYYEYNAKRIYERKKQVNIREYIKIMILKKCLSQLENL